MAMLRRESPPGVFSRLSGLSCRHPRHDVGPSPADPSARQAETGRELPGLLQPPESGLRQPSDLPQFPPSEHVARSRGGAGLPRLLRRERRRDWRNRSLCCAQQLGESAIQPLRDQIGNGLEILWFQRYLHETPPKKKPARDKPGGPRISVTVAVTLYMYMFLEVLSAM